MQESEKHKKDLLHKYIEGKINEKDRHELERLALDDPFLFETLEGYSLHGDDASLNHIEKLRKTEIAKQENKSLLPIIRFLRIAAGFILVGAAVYFLNNSLVDDQKLFATIQEGETSQFAEDISVKETNKFSKQDSQGGQERAKLMNEDEEAGISSAVQKAEALNFEEIKVGETNEEELKDERSLAEALPQEVENLNQMTKKRTFAMTSEDQESESIEADVMAAPAMRAKASTDILKRSFIEEANSVFVPQIGWENFVEKFREFRSDSNLCEGQRVYLFSIEGANTIEVKPVGRNEDNCDLEFRSFLQSSSIWTLKDPARSNKWRFSVDF